MNAKLTITVNNKKPASLSLKRMEKSLTFSKEDTDLYFFLLFEIVQNHVDISVQTQSWKYLVKQDKLQHILNNLINRLSLLKEELSPNKFNSFKFTQQVEQLEEEIRIFNEIHYMVKRSYLCFANENFQENWRAIKKVA